MEGKSFKEGLAEITETLKRLQSTLLFHQTKLKESFRQARQDFSLARRDISLATEKLHRSIKAAIKNRTFQCYDGQRKLFWRKFIVTIDRTRRPKSIQSVVMLRLGHHHPSVARGNIRVLGLNVQRDVAERIRWLAKVMVKSDQAKAETMQELEKMSADADIKRSEFNWSHVSL
ncbi:hypothetical protein Tco_1224760 [Tanacetum coccineum]